MTDIDFMTVLLVASCFAFGALILFEAVWLPLAKRRRLPPVQDPGQLQLEPEGRIVEQARL